MSETTACAEIQPVLIQDIRWGLMRAQLLSTAVELDLFTRIEAGESTPEKLAVTLSCPIRSVRILLDGLVAIELLQKGRGRYKLGTEARAFLVRDRSGYFGGGCTLSSRTYQDWAQLSAVVKSGKPLQDFAETENAAEFFKDLVAQLFASSFASSMILGKKLGVGKSLSNLKMLDIGCGSAAWSLAFTLLDQGAQVTALDFAPVLEVAKSFTKKYHVQSQYQFWEADFHAAEFPNNAFDVIFLGHICHMEGEAGTRKLLRRCYDALKPGGKLLIAEYVTNDLKTGPSLPLLFALNMLLYTEQGDVFSAKEMKRWLTAAKFRKVLLQKVQYPVSVVVAVK